MFTEELMKQPCIGCFTMNVTISNIHRLSQIVWETWFSPKVRLPISSCSTINQNSVAPNNHLGCSRILWVRDLERARWEWLCPALWCLGPQLGWLQWLALGPLKLKGPLPTRLCFTHLPGLCVNKLKTGCSICGDLHGNLRCPDFQRDCQGSKGKCPSRSCIAFCDLALKVTLYCFCCMFSQSSHMGWEWKVGRVWVHRSHLLMEGLSKNWQPRLKPPQWRS